MDYITKPISRKKLRSLARVFRSIFGVPQTGPFPVLNVLEELKDKFPKASYIVVDNKDLPKQIEARCVLNKNGTYTIEIKKRVYDGAYEKGIGAYRGFILHEIMHVFMSEIGFKPIYNRSFKKAKPYEFIEWQVKAITGEVAIPYEESRGMSMQKIIAKYKVSRGFAETRIRNK